MIKGCGYGKLLKQLFISLLISCFGLLANCFVSAIDFSLSGSSYIMDYGKTYQYQDRDYYFDIYGNIFTLDKPFFYWNTVNGYGNYPLNFVFGFQGSGLYFAIGSPGGPVHNQGFIDKFCITDVLNENTCVGAGQYNSSLTGMGVIENVYIDSIGWVSPTLETPIRVCLKDSDYYYCYSCGYSSNCPSGLTGNSLNLSNVDFSTIYSMDWDFNIYTPNIHGSSNVEINDSLSGDYVYTTCTYGDIIEYSENAGLNKYLCYGGLDNFDFYNRSGDYTIVPGSGKTLSEIFNYITYPPDSTPKEKFSYWNGLYIAGNDDNGVNISMWENMPAVLHSYIQIYNNYGGSQFDFDTVYQYCKFKLSNISGFNDMEYHGDYFSQTCDYIKRNGMNNLSNSGQSVLGLNWNGVGELSGNDVKDGISFIQGFFDKAKDSINTIYGYGAGFLPTYLILFLLAVIFFNFLRK